MSKIRSLKVLLLAVLVFALGQMAHAAAPQRKTLDNGLTVLVQENHASPVVAVRFYVRVGSLYEGKYVGSGISHLFEHVLWEGTESMSKKEFNDAVQAIGGQSNAYTTTNVTAYHLMTSSQYFDRALELLSDMMQRPAMTPEAVKTEQGIIHHEMALGEDNPARQLYYLFNKTAFQVSPIRYPTIGYRAQFDALTRDDILSFFHSHYTPGNTVLSVAGDIDAQEVFDAAEKYLKDWPEAISAQPPIATEPRQVTPRTATIYRNVGEARAMMGWHTVRLQHPDLYALDVLAQILGGSDSSRLVRDLRDGRDVVTSISSYSNTPDYDAGIFAVTASLPSENIEKMQRAVFDQIIDIKKNGVTAQELALAKHQIDTDFVFNNSSVDQIAERIASDYIATGDETFSQNYVDNIQQVTSEQIQAVAQKYFSHQNVTSVFLKPLSEQPKTAATAENSNEVQDPQIFTLANGMRVIVRENHTQPTVGIALTGIGGLLSETPQNQGIANLTAQMLERSTSRRTYQQFRSLIDEKGADFNSSSGYNSWIITSRWLSKDWRSGISMVNEAALHPAFKEQDLRQVKQQTQAAIARQAEDPSTLGQLLAFSTYYNDYPYGHSKLGTSQSVAGFATADLKNYWNNQIDPQKMVLSVYGDIDTDDVKKVVDYLFGNIRRGNANIVGNSFSPPTQQINKTQEAAGITQTVINYVFPGMTVDSEDRYALTVMNAALAGIYYPGGRLFARLRGAELVYSSFAFSQPGVNTGSFVVNASTTADKIDDVKKIIEEELQKLRDSDISADELARGKSMAIAAQDVSLQGNLSQARDAATDELLGLGYDDYATYAKNINAVTAAQVRAVAQKYLREDNSVIAIVKPQ